MFRRTIALLGGVTLALAIFAAFESSLIPSHGEICERAKDGTDDCERYNILFYATWAVAQRLEPWSALITAIATVVLMFLTVVLAATGWFQWKDGRITNRAWIAVEACGISRYIARKGDDEGERILAHFGMRNTGKLAARHVKWRFATKVSEEEKETEFPLAGATWYGDNPIAPNTMVRQGGNAICLSEIQEFRYLYFWGEVWYQDGFCHSQSTHFCHRYSLNRLDFRPDSAQLIKSKYGRQYEHGNKAT